MADKTISNLNALAAPASDDEIAIVDTNVSETKKMTIANLNSGLDHDSLSGFVSNEHIDWTNASNNLDTSGTISTVDQTFSTTSSHYRLRSIVQKTAGATDADDDLTSIYGIVRLNDADSTMGDLRSIYGGCILEAGTIGENKDGYGGHFVFFGDGGTASQHTYGAYIENENNGATVSGDAFGGKIELDHNSGTISGDATSLYVRGDWDGTVTGTAYGLQVSAATNADYVIYSSSSSNNGSYLAGDFEIGGTLTKGDGTFKIDHPLDPKNKTLYYGFVESPRYDLIHRGTVKLKNGKIKVNIDKYYGLTKGTFEALTRDAQVMNVQAINSFVRVKATEITGSEFTIQAEDPTFDGEVNWFVLAERNDPYIKTSKLTDETGRLVNEVEKGEPKGNEFDDKVEYTEGVEKETYEDVSMKDKKGYYNHPKAYGKELYKRKIIKKHRKK